MSDDELHLRQELNAQRDGFAVGRDLHYHAAPSTLGPAPSPAAVKRVWGDVPARNPGFTGRERLLTAIRDAFASGGRAAIQALHGLGGVGKTQLAIEYTHRHATDYDIVWWLNSKSAALLGEQFATLAAELSCAPDGTSLDTMRRAVRAELHDRDRWLLIFDNVENPEDIAAWLPGGIGHVLITSRAPNWHDLAAPVAVDVFDRAESITALRYRVSHLSEADADRAAEALGDLPLAVAQAARYMADTGTSAGEYTDLLESRATEIMETGNSWTYPQSLVAVTRIGFERLNELNEAAAQLALICSFLGSEPIPARWFPRAARQMPPPLRELAADPLTWRELLAAFGRSALARIEPDGIIMHRLTQAILRENGDSDQGATARRAAGLTVLANHPGNPDSMRTWPAWGRMIPHIMATGLAARSDDELKDMAVDAVWYLIQRGENHAAHRLVRRLHEDSRARLGPWHERTLWISGQLATTLARTGKWKESRKLNEQVLSRQRQRVGPDHAATLAAACNLADDLRELGDLQRARELYEDTHERRRRIAGPDDPETLLTATSLSLVLHMLGENERALTLIRDSFIRLRRTQGPDSPNTLSCALNFASTLRALGKFGAARRLAEDTVTRSRESIGRGHLVTLSCEYEFARDLQKIGEHQRAQELLESTFGKAQWALGEDHEVTQAVGKALAYEIHERDEE